MHWITCSQQTLLSKTGSTCTSVGKTEINAYLNTIVTPQDCLLCFILHVPIFGYVPVLVMSLLGPP